MNTQPPYGYDPQQPYGPGQPGASAGATGQQGYPPPGYPPPGYAQSEQFQQGYPPPPYPPQYPQTDAYGRPIYGAYGMPGPTPAYDDKAGFAIAGLVLGILSLVLSCATFCDAPFFVLGLIFSYLGLQSTTQRNLAVAGLVTSGAGLLLSILLFGLFATRGAFHYYYIP